MPSQLMPGAANWIARGNRNMLGGPPRATHHITWDELHEDGTRLITLDQVSRYLVNVGYEPHVVIDPFTGEIRQLLEAESSGYALQNKGVQTNRRGTVNLQVEWFFTPGTVYKGKRYDSLIDTPMLGLPEFLAWCDSWGIPRVAPLAPKDRNQTVWAGVAGHYGHFNAPLNDHTDPIVSIRSILDMAELPATPTLPEEDELFSPAPSGTVHIVALHSQLLLTTTGGENGDRVIQAAANGSLNQRWQQVGHADGTVSLVNQANELALDRPDGADSAGTVLQVWQALYNDNQRWTIEHSGPFRRIWVQLPGDVGTNRCVDVAGGTPNEGDLAVLWYGKGPEGGAWTNQMFIFVPVR